MKAALLPDRGVVKVAGLDARAFLNGLLTTDIAKVTPDAGAIRRAANAAGQDHRRLHRRRGAGRGRRRLLPRLPARAGAGLVQKLNFYKLRAKVICEDLSEVLGVMAVWDGSGSTEYGLIYADPRLAALGQRVMLPPHLAKEAAADLGAELVEAADLRGASHRAGRAARRARLHLWRCVPARNRHGPARRHRFRQGLLRRPGGGVAHGASRYRAHPRRAGRGAKALRRTPACR